MKNKYRSDLSKAKNLGSAGSGSGHWWHQRLTAILLTLITAWLFYFFWDISNSKPSEIIEVFNKPYHVLMLTLFVMAGFYHAALGMQVVIEDYVHCRAVRLSLILMVQIFSIVTALAFILAVLYVMTL
ncbi:MAG: succinate dehydrogenase, hydrophobic membrane anchor protein [Rickettsiaceae bacterium]|nr:succinate dehydrogenase, hydrophobic membrane anchor protein [Rickettsiaceae bacterium]